MFKHSGGAVRWAIATVVISLGMVGCVPDDDCSVTATCPPPDEDDSGRSALDSSQLFDVSAERLHDGSLSIDQAVGTTGDALANDASTQLITDVLVADGTLVTTSDALGTTDEHRSNADDGDAAQESGSVLPTTCANGRKLCGGQCVAIDDSTYGCGTTTCDASRCPKPGTATLICQGGACVIGACGAGTKKCGTACVSIDNPSYGCSVGSCAPCATLAGGTTRCSANTCASSCNDGNAPCNGQCPDYKIDSQNCGGCGKKCGACIGGVCCAIGEVVANGICCPSGKVNVGGICCSNGLANCGGKCVDLSNDAQHCGSCPNTCISPVNGVSTCTASNCVTKIDACLAKPCLNGGTCTSVGNGFTCSCAVGWKGSTCDIRNFQGLGIPAPYMSSSANSVSDDGSVVVGNVTDTAHKAPARWTSATGMTVLTAGCGDALAIAPNGLTIVGSFDASCADVHTQAPVKWFGGTWMPLDRFDSGPNGLSTGGWAQGVSADGSVVVGREWFGSTSTAVRWTSAGPASLVSADAQDGWGVGVSGSGSVVVGNRADDNGLYTAFRWEAGQVVVLSPPGGWVDGLSSDGSVAVGAIGTAAAKWVGAQAGTSLGFQGHAYAANRDGSIIVGETGAEAFVWKSGSLSFLSALVDTSGWSSLKAHAVSSDGTIVVGQGLHSGNSEAWIARLP